MLQMWISLVARTLDTSTKLLDNCYNHNWLSNYIYSSIFQLHSYMDNSAKICQNRKIEKHKNTHGTCTFLDICKELFFFNICQNQISLSCLHLVNRCLIDCINHSFKYVSTVGIIGTGTRSG